MIEFLRKFENRFIKIGQDNSILITKSLNLHLFTLILYGFGVRCDHIWFSVLSPFKEKSMIQQMNNSQLDTIFSAYSLKNNRFYKVKDETFLKIVWGVNIILHSYRSNDI